MHLIRHILRRTRTRAEDGFALVTTMGIILVVTMLSVAAFAATDGDTKPGADDKQTKAAYAAAEAGIQDYLARLIANSDYWRLCDDATHPGLNQKNPGGARQWANIADSPAQYSIELLPAPTKSTCDANDASGTFIDSSNGTFRIRSTGRSSSTSKKKRSVIATFRRRNFLNYVYFTDYETSDPAWYYRGAQGQVTRENPRTPPLQQRDVVAWASEECTYWRDGRGDKAFLGNSSQNSGRYNGSSWSTYTVGCGEINFVGNAQGTDEIRGPFHTNDEILVCGNPIFGRNPSDQIEVSGPSPGDTGAAGEGWRNCGSGSPQVNFPGSGSVNQNRGTWVKSAPLLTLPPSNAALKDDALPQYRFKGKTSINLTNTTMTVTGRRENGTPLSNVSMPLPDNGVVYVGNDTNVAHPACTGYQVLDPYGASQNCGDVWVRGTYQKSVTITAQNDIVIEDDVTRNGDHLLGLISENWLRVYHPTTGCTWSSSSGTNNGGPGAITIEAALLSLKHSFTVDSYWCGAHVGDLNVTGVIAQKYRGPVGEVGGSGYIKNYQYDDRLLFRSPPYFLDPVQSGWGVLTQVEQVPAAS